MTDAPVDAEGSFPLTELEIGASAVVDRLPADVPNLRRIREMGVVPGTRVKLLRRAPLGDPLEISVRGGLLSLRIQEAALIQVRAL